MTQLMECFFLEWFHLNDITCRQHIKDLERIAGSLVRWCQNLLIVRRERQAHLVDILFRLMPVSFSP